ncbi:MAG: hypothetical protein GF332_01580 [Candidatus Moranbacteria bacterium]|nr:hypothetical protein [Candidatus Moranbacteria bacterium]
MAVPTNQRILKLILRNQSVQKKLEAKAKKLFDKAQQYNDTIFIIALMFAVMSEFTDLLPPPLDVGISPIIKFLFVAIPIWWQMGWRRHLWKKFLRIILPIIIDLIAAFIPFLDGITPITTIMVLLAWRSSKKQSEKNLERSQEIVEKSQKLTAQIQRLRAKLKQAN